MSKRVGKVTSKDIGVCVVCGKKSYTSRKTARKAAREHHPGEPLTTYQCSTGYYHYGHVAPRVRQGYVDRKKAHQ